MCGLCLFQLNFYLRSHGRGERRKVDDYSLMFLFSLHLFLLFLLEEQEEQREQSKYVKKSNNKNRTRLKLKKMIIGRKTTNAYTQKRTPSFIGLSIQKPIVDFSVYIFAGRTDQQQHLIGALGTGLV